MIGVADLHFAELFLHVVNVPGRHPSSIPDTPQGALRASPGVGTRHFFANRIDNHGRDRSRPKHRQGEAHRAPGATMHEVPKDYSGRHPQDRRSTLRAGFHKASSGIVRFAVHEANLTHTRTSKNKKFIT